MSFYEQKIIGGVLSGRIPALSVPLDPADMERFGDALRVAREIEGEALIVSPDILALRLGDVGSFYTAEDFDLMARSVESTSIVYEAIDKVKSRALKAFLTTRLASLATSDQTGKTTLDDIKALIQAAEQRYASVENSFVFLKDITPKLEAVYDDLYNNVSYAVPTGYGSIDGQILDGFSKGDLHIIVGFTGHGKSGLALNFAHYQALVCKLVVGIVSREMSDIENVMRLQSSTQKIERWKIRTGMRSQTYEALKGGIADLNALPIAIDTRTENIEALRVQAKRMMEEHRMGILYVDYLQLMGSAKGKTRADEVATISRNLKLIAMENNIPVVALCQFNRGAGDADIYDILSHIKESSGIEQDASTVMFIQVEKTKELKDIKDAKLYVLKNRNGATFHPIQLHFNGPMFTFSEVRDDG